MRLLTLACALVVSAPFATTIAAQQAPAAIFTDPPRDKQHPARMEVLHIPSGGVKINGVAYLASGAGKHPTIVIAHGLPGNEKNLDLAQAVRRAGWNAITFNYRGSWGSPGVFRFAQNLDDANAVLAYLRAPAHADSLGIDTTRLVLAGHSMGGWVTVNTAARDHRLRGAILISAADMATHAYAPRAQVEKMAADNMESLAGVTAASMATEIISLRATRRFADNYAGLGSMPLLVVTSDDGLAPENDSLVVAVRSRGNRHVTAVHFATDHSYSDQRIALESAVIRWLQALPR